MSMKVIPGRRYPARVYPREDLTREVDYVPFPTRNSGAGMKEGYVGQNELPRDVSKFRAASPVMVKSAGSSIQPGVSAA